MSKRKLSEDVDELFVQKPTWTSVTKTVAIESPEFMMKIEKKHYTLHLHVILIVFWMTFRATMWQFGMQFF